MLHSLLFLTTNILLNFFEKQKNFFLCHRTLMDPFLLFPASVKYVCNNHYEVCKSKRKS